MQTGVRDRSGQIGIDNAGLDDSELIVDVDFQDAIHARKRNDDAAVARERAAGKARARAASNDGHVVMIGNFDDADDIGGIARKNDAVGTRDFHGAVVFIEKQIFGTDQDVFASEKMLEVGNESLIHGRLDVRE